MSKPVSVVNLTTGQVQTYVGPTPEEAVRCAYLQARGDWNTWEYATRDVPMQFGAFSVAAGDFAARVW